MRARLPRASMGHTVLLTLHSDGNRPLCSYLHTGTLPGLVSFVSHSYAPFASQIVLRGENTGGVGVFFPFWNSSLPVVRRHAKRYDPLSTCQCSNLPTLQRLLGLSPFFPYPCVLFCTYAKLNSFPFKSFRTLCQKPPGVGGTALLRRLDVQTFGRSDAFLISPKVLYFQYRER